MELRFLLIFFLQAIATIISLISDSSLISFLCNFVYLSLLSLDINFIQNDIRKNKSENDHKYEITIKFIILVIITSFFVLRNWGKQPNFFLSALMFANTILALIMLVWIIKKNFLENFLASLKKANWQDIFLGAILSYVLTKLLDYLGPILK